MWLRNLLFTRIEFRNKFAFVGLLAKNTNMWCFEFNNYETRQLYDPLLNFFVILPTFVGYSKQKDCIINIFV
jgi:hypothetical protein